MRLPWGAYRVKKRAQILKETNIATLFETVQLLKKWHFQSLSKVEKKFIDDILNNAGDGSQNPSDQILMKDNAVTLKMSKWIRDIGKRFLINKATKV